MQFAFKGEKIDYSYFANNANTILFLHGWGGSKHSFENTINILKPKFSIITITLPTTQATNCVWTLNDYANLVLNILSLYNINSISLICHSFGFRVACLLNKRIKVNKIVVTGGAGPNYDSIIKKLESENKRIFLNKWTFLYVQLASRDYKALTKTNKQTFKNIVNAYTNNLLKFDCPMLLFWGKRDVETKIKIAKQLKKINEAKLVITPSGHFAYLDNNALFNNEVIKFLN